MNKKQQQAIDNFIPSTLQHDRNSKMDELLELLEVCFTKTPKQDHVDTLINKAISDFIDALAKIDNKYDTVDFSNRLDDLLARTV